MNTINGKPLGGVLTWESQGRWGGVGGQTVGADGAGQFAAIITGAHEEAEDFARAYLKKLEQAGHTITSATFVCNDEDGGYLGNPIFIINPDSEEICSRQADRHHRTID